MDTFYNLAFDKNHHLNKNVYHDCFKLLDRCHRFYLQQRTLPTDSENMKYFGWTKDHLDRCYQMLKKLGVVSYSRNNRRHTLKFLGKFYCLNEYLPTNNKKERLN